MRELDETFVTQEEIHELAVKKGWWDDPDLEKTIPEKLMLIVSELAEALEEYRMGHPPTEIYFESANGQRKPCGFGIELADAAIRIRDLSQALEIDLESSIYIKHQFNRTRPVRHGNKRA